MTTHKDIDPEGFLLNDNDIGVDHLGEFTFVDAIADSVHQVETPITIGLFARWGSGKSFLLRHLESLLKKYQKQDVIDEKKKQRAPETPCKTLSILKTTCWILSLVFILFIIVCTLIMAIRPAFFELIFMPDKFSDSKSTNALPSNITTILPMTEPEMGLEMPDYLRTMKIIGLVLIPVEILIVFIVSCCGNTWMSCHYYGSFRLITYGTFTKLPVRSPQQDIVDDPGQQPTEVLTHIKPGDERLAIAASEAALYSRRYIFVDFKAWEYAGSDTLWAGIVTKLSDAIESEFGVITARLFRMLSVEDVSRSVLDCSERTIYVGIPSSARKDKIVEMMRQYGVVTDIKEVKAISARARIKTWQITYSTDAELRTATESLAIEGIRFQTEWPGNRAGKTKKNRRTESQRRLLKDQPDEYELQSVAADKKREMSEPEASALDLLKLPPKTSFCNRFCSHFSRYPVMLLCLPRLFWWILIIVCCFLIPITIHIIANELNLDVYRTYRPVTVAAQVLLWLPASVAVCVIGSRFFWAMCHSQRQRINQALDGTKTKMAEQLGFMDKVKTEVQVITKLLHCARFTHQRDYKVFISIDDLDRVPLDRVKSVLEAVSILLSDKSSPFICLVAVDPRIVVKCVEEGSGNVLAKANVTGHEYLKKIINLPICLPEIGDSAKKRYIAGLIDQADHTVTYRAYIQQPKFEYNTTTLDSPRCEEHVSTSNETDSGEDVADSMPNNDDDRITKTDFGATQDENQGRPLVNHGTEQMVNGPSANNVQSQRQISVADVTELGHKTFLFECRHFIYNDQELRHHLQGNPRNIKRIFNVVSLTARIINSLVKKQERRKFIHSIVCESDGKSISEDSSLTKKPIVRTAKFAHDLVRWIVLTDQWPYRTSYILQVIEDAQQRTKANIPGEELPREWTIPEIFINKVMPEIAGSDRSLLSLDGDPDLFLSYLSILKDAGFTPETMTDLEKYTVNLDHSIRHNIAFGRDLVGAKESENEEEKSEKTKTPKSSSQKGKKSKVAKESIAKKEHKIYGEIPPDEVHENIQNKN